MISVAIPSLPCGNLASVAKMVEFVGGSPKLVANPEELAGADRIILAGVGAFDEGMSSLRTGDWEPALRDAVFGRGKPLLGVCLGMQMLFDGSQEGALPGLGWLPGQVIRFDLPIGSPLKVPHVGWSEINVKRPNPLVDVNSLQDRFYFVHSYHAACAEDADVIATAVHGYEFPALVGRANIFGAQFHPEKSHRFGMSLMRRFLEVS